MPHHELGQRHLGDLDIGERAGEDVCHGREWCTTQPVRTSAGARPPTAPDSLFAFGCPRRRDRHRVSHPLSTVFGMALAEIPSSERASCSGRRERRSLRDVRAAGHDAVAKLAHAERLRAEAVAQLVEFDAINGHVADGYLTPQRHLIDGAGVAEAEARRIIRLVRFCELHPLVGDQLAAGLITVEHADALCKLATQVNTRELADTLPDLLHAAVGVELSVFCDRIRTWRWRIQPEITDEDLDTLYENRSLTMQPGLFGGMRGNFQLDAAGAAVVADALQTQPDPLDTIEGPRSLRQRQADRLVELAALAGLIDDDMATADSDEEPAGARQQSRPTVDVIIDLPTLLGADFSLDDHRTETGDVDWESIEASFALTGPAPRRVMQQFFCDASWRTLITAGGSIVLDYTHAKPEVNRSQRRAVQRRDRHCQFAGCDRHWSWCDVHHLRSKEDGGWDLFDNLVLLCRRHHTMVHHQGWQLWRHTDGRIRTTTP